MVLVVDVVLWWKMFTSTVMTAAAAFANTTTKYKQPDWKWSSSQLACFSTQYEKY